MLNIYHLAFCIFSCDYCEFSSEIFKSFGLFGLEITCIAKIDTNLKNIPIPIRIRILESRSDGVLGYVFALHNRIEYNSDVTDIVKIDEKSSQEHKWNDQHRN
jgi:hypothetical protein